MDINIFYKWIQEKDAHIVRFFSSFVLISEGRAVKATEPYLTECPLAKAFYKDLRGISDKKDMEKAIIKLADDKIKMFGHFTKDRTISDENIAVPFGASEIMMFALKKGVIDATVVVCDGAGTVVVDKPSVVQGIGARMNGLFYTSPVSEIIDELERSGSCVVFDDARIDQIAGVRKAAEMGYKNIAVTVNACMNDDITIIDEIEKEFGISVVSLIVCTTGINSKRILQINDCADMVWACASSQIREHTGKNAILQLSVRIPVFVLTGKGLKLAAAYSSDADEIEKLDLRKQYIVGSTQKGKKMRMGDFDVFLSEAELPVRSRREPF